MVVTASFFFHLPLGSQLKLKEGDLVNSGDLIAKIKLSPMVKEYPLAEVLNISSGRIMNCFLKKLGEVVEEGDLVAESKTMLGKPKAKFVSPISGVLDSLTEEGILRIKLPSGETEIKAPFPGQIAAVSKKQVELAFPAQELKADWGVGIPQIGTIFCLEKQQADVFDLNGDFQGKIVVVQGGFNHGFWYKAASLGLAGVVASGLTNKSLREIIEQEAVEKEGFKLPVLFYETAMAPQIWQVFQKNEGKKAVIEGLEKRILFPKE